MSDTPGWAGAQGPDEQFTVPLPQPAPAPAPEVVPAGAAPTQALPVADQTREMPVAGPGWAAPPPPATAPVPANPYAGQPVWPTSVQERGGRGTVQAGDDPLIAHVGTALFWVTIGWWGFLLIRLLGFLSRFGAADTMLIRTIDRGAEETIVAAGVSVLAAVLLLSVDRGHRAPLTLASIALAVVTVGIAVWRVLP